MKRILYISAILMTSLLASCDRFAEDFGGGDEEAVVSFSISTKAASDGTAANGDVMNNLHILLVDEGNTVRARANSLYATGGVVIKDSGTKASGELRNVPQGRYTLLAVANIPRGLTVPAVGASAADLINHTLALETTLEPTFTETDGMPLTLVEEVSVTPGINRFSFSLERVCGKIRIRIRNQAEGQDLYIQNLKLSENNPSGAFLFAKEDGSRPYGTEDMAFKSVERDSDPVKILFGEDRVVLEQNVFETGFFDMMSLTVHGGVQSEGSALNIGDDSYVIEKRSIGEVTYEMPAAGVPYLIENADDKYYNHLYLCPDIYFGNLTFAYATKPENFMEEPDMERYFWVNSASATDKRGTYRTIKTYADEGVYLNVSSAGAGLSGNPVNVYSKADKDGALLWGVRGNTPYYLNGYLETATNTNEMGSYWRFHPLVMTSTTVHRPVIAGEGAHNFDKRVEELKYVDEFGAPMTLHRIGRNEILDLVINVFFYAEESIVYFRVEPWTEVGNETTFD